MPTCGRVMEVSCVAREEYVQFDVRTDPYSGAIPFTEYFRRSLPDATVELTHGKIVIKIGKDDDAAAAERLLELFKTSITILDDADESHALGMHSYENGRSELGDLVYGAKPYQKDETHPGKLGASQQEQELAKRAVKWIGDHPTYRDARVVAAVPSSTRVNNLPQMIANSIANTYQMKLCQIDSTSTVQRKHQQDEDGMQDKFSISGDLTSYDVILIDDLYGSGATMVEGVRALREVGAKSVLALAMTKNRLDTQGLYAYKNNWEDM